MGTAREVKDLVIDYLNPAGQRVPGLTERPGGDWLVVSFTDTSD